MRFNVDQLGVTRLMGPSCQLFHSGFLLLQKKLRFRELLHFHSPMTFLKLGVSYKYTVYVLARLFLVVTHMHILQRGADCPPKPASTQ